MVKETKPRVVDQDGLPLYEECNYIKIDGRNLKQVENILKDNHIHFKTFNDAGECFCEDEAEFRIRQYHGSNGLLETICEKDAMQDKLCVGSALFAALLVGTLLDNDNIEKIVADCMEGIDDGAED